MHDVEATRLLHSMLRIGSPAGQEGRLARFLVAELDYHGIQAAVAPGGHLVAQVGSGPRTLALAGRLTTPPIRPRVDGRPAAEGEWSGPIDPARHASAGEQAVPVRVEGPHLYGRGALHGKGPLATFAAALVRYARHDRGGLRVLLVGLADGGPGPRSSFASGGEHAPDLAILGEAGGWDCLAVGWEGAGGSEGVGEDRADSAAEGPDALDSLPARSRRAASSNSDSLGLRAGSCAEIESALGSAIRRRTNDEPRRTTERSREPIAEYLAKLWRCPLTTYGAGDPETVELPEERVSLADFTRSIEVVEDALHELARGRRRHARRSSNGPRPRIA